MNPAFLNIASHLPKQAERQPDMRAVVCPEGRTPTGQPHYAQYTFRELNDASDRIAHGLRQLGIVQGTRTVLMVKPSRAFFALTFALFKLGAVPVLVDPGMGIANLGQCLHEAEPAAFIGVPRAQMARVLFRWARPTLRIIVTVGTRWLWRGSTLAQIERAGAAGGAFPPAPTPPDDTAAILFTSGSTGVPKGAVYTHRIFETQVDMLRRTYGIEPGEIDLCTFPLFALFAPALGMTAIVPDMDATRPAQVEPRNILEPIATFGVTNLFGSPALLRRVGEPGAARNVRLPTLRRVISAGAPVPAEVLERFAAMLAPGVQIFTPYGATEALPVASVGSDEILSETRSLSAEGAGICVGRPVDGIRVRIIKITDEPIPTWSDELLSTPGEIGEIAVQGSNVTRSYFNRLKATVLAKIADPAGAGCYHRMGDLGYFDAQQRLWFCGRKSQRVRTAEGTLFTIPCEGVFNAHPKVLRSALVGVGVNGAARPVLCVELRQQTSATDLPALEKELRVLGAARPHTQGIRTILFHPSFPVDIRHNAKIGREKLAEWATEQTRN